MKQLRKFRSNYFSAGILTASIAVIFCSLTWKTTVAHSPSKYFYSTLTTWQDTVPTRKPDSLHNRNDTLVDTTVAQSLLDTTKPNQKVDTFAFKVSKDSLDAPVKYEAEDSAVVLITDKKIFLYGKTKTEYKDITLTAPKVEIDQQTQIVTAFNRVDSLGEVVERANFKQGESAFQSDTIKFNFKTQKGLTKNTFTQSGDVFLESRTAKKVNPSTMYARNGVMTTCDLDDPHFGFHYDKIKIINNKVAVSGPIHPEFEGVPIPIYLPFGIFPLSHGRHSGFLSPSIETNEQYGLGLVNGGYYKVINQYWDVTFRGDIYSYGGWRLTVSPTYRTRYKFNGGFNFTVLNTKINFKGDPDYSQMRTYSVQWNHTVDSRARPGTNFSASVNASSTQYNRNIPNSPQQNFQNQQTSSITYSKSWLQVGKPFNLTISANHNQNNNLHYINLNLPDVGFTVNTVYPFQRKEFVGAPKWYEKLGIGYNGSFNNTITFYDTVKYGQNGVKPFWEFLLDTAQWSAHHSIPVTLSLPPILGGALMISPGVSYGQDWLEKITVYKWDTANKRVDTAFHKGLYVDQKASVSLGFNTALFGKYEFRKFSIRHVMRPTIGFSYSPDLNKKFLQKVVIDSTGRELSYNQFGGSIVSYSGGRSFGGINFQLDNNLEMKVRSKKDSTNNGIKKVRLIDGFGFSGSYDLMADSFQLTSPSFYFRSTLFDKISITGNAVMNPYDYDKNGFPINKLFSHNGKFYLGRMTNGNLSVSTDFKSKPKDKAQEDSKKKQMDEIMNSPNMIDQQNLLDYMRHNPAEFIDFNIPWSVNLGLSVSFYERVKADYSGFEKKFSSNLTFGGNFLLTPKWNFMMNGYYDLDTKSIQTLTMNISRDMHCWQMSISITPVGLYRFFSVNISPKSSMLQDLRINRTRTFSSQ